MHLEICKLHPNAATPTYGTAGAACFDLYAAETTTIPPRGRAAVTTGLAVALEPGYGIEIHGRSGLAFRHGIIAFGGQVDSDFRGPVQVLLINTSDQEYTIEQGDRVAQGRVVYSPRVTFIECEQLTLTERGQAGYGSTGH